MDGGAGESDSAGVSETGRVHRIYIAISGPGSGGLGRDRSFGDLSVCVDLASRGGVRVWGCGRGLA